MSATKVKMQAVPAHEEDLMSQQSNSSTLTQKVLLLVGVLNAALLGFFVHQVHQYVPAAHFVAEHQNELHRFLSITSSMSDASVRLFHGSIPNLLNDLLTSDLSGAAYDTEKWADEVHSATCTYSNDKNDYANNALFYISKYSSLVHSVANQMANINDLTPSGDDGGDDTVQLSGDGGMTLEPLKYVTDFIKDQTVATQWKTTACSCESLAEQLKSTMPFADVYGADCGQTSLSYDVQSNALQILNSVSTTCSSLCLNLASESEEKQANTEEPKQIE
jgi:hypothetical protein